MGDYLSTFFDLMRGMAPGKSINRSPVMANGSLEGFIVSTVVTADKGPETAILAKNGTFPVERYDTTEDAKKGHIKWCDWVRAGNTKLTELSYGIVPAEEKTAIHFNNIEMQEEIADQQ